MTITITNYIVVITINRSCPEAARGSNTLSLNRGASLEIQADSVAKALCELPRVDSCKSLRVC